MRKSTPQSFSSYNGESTVNGNYQVTLDFSQGPRGVVTIQGTPSVSNWPKGSAPKTNPHIWQQSKKKQ